MKVIAYYLPQFHRIPQNDAWWGGGFTEWTNVKKAKPLFKGHYQPRVPIHGAYYDLSDPRVMASQAELATSHGIHAFCYYHYWFNGTRLLEKPLENMLQSPQVRIPFCLSWANEPWTRAWDGQHRDVLMPQDYGGEREWTDHFECLLRFFKDPRHLRIENRPVFLIYRTSSIPRLDEMLQTWDTLAEKAGIPGVYLIETMNSFQKIPAADRSNAVVEFEPMFTLTHHYPQHLRAWARLSGLLGYGGLNTKGYRSVWNEVTRIRVRSYGSRDVFPCAFPDWDNSPRKGRGALIIRGASPSVFKLYLKELVSNWRFRTDTRLVFLNAWNEWAEGAYVEPDSRFGLDYLRAIKEVVE